MKQNRALPGWCGILDGLISENPKGGGKDPEELKSLLAKVREGEK